MYYLDTSLLVAALTNEARTANVQRWLAVQSPEDLNISDWVVTEFSGALALKLRTKQLTPKSRSESLAEFAKLLRATFDVKGVSSVDFRMAARFVDQSNHALRSADALHLAIAASHGLKIITLDKVFAKAAIAFGVGVELV